MTIIKNRTYKLPLLLLLLGALAYLSGCINIDIESGYSVSNINDGQRYVGLAGDSVPAGVTQPAMPEIILFHYTQPKNQLLVYINGQAIGSLLDYGPSQAVLEVDKIKALLRQGKNTFNVEPLSFGPSIDFNFDNQGPMLDIAAVENINDAIHLTVRAQDTVNVKEVKIERMNYSFDGATEVVDGQIFKTDSVSATGEVTPLENQGKGLWSAGNIQAADLYKIQAEDSYGYITTDYYLAPNQVINNAFKLKLDKVVLDDVVPLMKDKIKDIHLYAPKEMASRGQVPSADTAVASDTLDKLSEWWKSSGVFYGDVGAATKGYYNAGKAYEVAAGSDADCGYADINLDNVNLQKSDFACPAGKIKRALNAVGQGTNTYYCELGDIEYTPAPDKIKPGHCSRIVMTEVKVRDADNLSFTLDNNKVNRLHVETKVNDLNVRMGINHVSCGFDVSDYYAYYQFPNKIGKRGITVDKNTGVPTGNLYSGPAKGGFCREVGEAKHLSVGLGNLKVNAKHSDMKGDVDVHIKDGDLSLAVAKGFSLGLSSDLSIGNSGIDWILGALAPVLNNMFVGIVEDTLKQNMKDFKLGFDLFSDQDVAQSNAAGNVELENPSMQMQAKAYQVWTAKDASGAMQWNMYYSGYLHNAKNHADVGEVLGSRFVIEKPSTPADSNREVDISLNSNIINQALMAMYLSGVTHISVLDRAVSVDGESKQVLFGPHVTDTLAVRNGAVRVELMPSAPGTFTLQEGDSTGSQAVIHYRNATMHIDTYRSGAWKTDFIVHADLRVGLLMKAADSRLKVTLLGTPELAINSVQAPNAPGWFPSGILQPLVQLGVDLVANIAVPQITQNISDFALPLMPIEGTTKAIQLNIDQLEASSGGHLGLGLNVGVVDAE